MAFEVSQLFNGLLKTLEEPPEHVIFILATYVTVVLKTQNQSRIIEKHCKTRGDKSNFVTSMTVVSSVSSFAIWSAILQA